MIDEPSRLFNSFDFRDNDIGIHADILKNLHHITLWIKRFRISPGVALSPATPLAMLDYILDEIDGVLILTVNPGFIANHLLNRQL